MLENYFGDDTMRIYQGMQFATPDAERTVQDILKALDEYAAGIVNKTYERFVFRQEEGPIYQPLCSGRIWHKVNF